MKRKTERISSTEQLFTAQSVENQRHRLNQSDVRSAQDSAALTVLNP